MAFLILLICSAMISNAFAETNNHLEVDVYEFSNCPHTENLKTSFENISMMLDPDTKMLYVSGVMDMDMVWDESVELHLILKKCQNRDVNSCLTVFDAPVNKVCDHLAEKDKPWTSFVEHLDNFIPKCPVPAGKYEIDEAPIDMSSMKNMDAAIGVWHFQGSSMKDGVRVGCSDSALEVKQARRKRPNKKVSPIV